MTFMAESQLLIRAVKQSIGTGLLTVNGDIADLITRNATVLSSFDVLAGTGQIIRTPSPNVHNYRFIAWDAQTVPSGQTEGGFIVSVQDSGSGAGTREDPAIGTIVVVDNQGGTSVTPKQAVEFIPIGALIMSGGIITQAAGGTLLAGARVSSKYTSDAGTSVYNFSGVDGFEIDTLPAALQVGITAGSAFSIGAATIDDIEVPDEITRGERSPASIIALTAPVTGIFTFSATAEIDPLQVSKKGVITAFADAGGGNTIVTSNGHGIVTGDIPTVTNTTNYNATFNTVSHTGNTFTIDTPFVGDDATGNWSALTATSNSRFTGQRIFLLPQTGIVAITYGLAEYISIDDYDTSNGEVSEGFRAPGILERAVRTNILIVQESIVDFGESASFDMRKATDRFKA